MAKYLIVGGVAAGMSAAARLRRLDEAAEIIVFERGDYVSYANCGSTTYYIGDEIKERERLVVQTPEALQNLWLSRYAPKRGCWPLTQRPKALKAKDLKTGREYDETYDKLLLAPGGSR
ncbi:MAG: FAD-dependent oxidoreductase [Syntrophotaleaceae bacterium]